MPYKHSEYEIKTQKRRIKTKKSTIKRLLLLSISLTLCMGVLPYTSVVNATIVFEDDFDDGIIDSSKWVFGPNGTGGDVIEEDGVLKFILSDPSPYKQVRNSVDLYSDCMRLTLRINPVVVASSKNIGIYLRETPDDPTLLNGFYLQFNSTISTYALMRVTGAVYSTSGGYPSGAYDLTGYSILGPQSTTMNTWHDVELEKTGDVYEFSINGELKTTFTDSAPDSLPSQLYGTAGYLWDLRRDRETGELWLDDIKVYSCEGQGGSNECYNAGYAAGEATCEGFYSPEQLAQAVADARASMYTKERMIQEIADILTWETLTEPIK